MALAAYAKDLGVDLQCELYCDSSAALGIAQRAGIGKVRHLRTQGLWAQEIRVSGRIQYKKVLGTKKPADLLTKDMSAELARQHVATLNMKFEGGRATSAPTLDSVESFVQGWYEDLVIDSQEEQIDEQEEINRAGRHRVSFDPKVHFRPISAEGSGRKTPPRGSPSGRTRRSGVGYFVDSVISADSDGTLACSCGGSGLPTRNSGTRWCDFDESRCVSCSRLWNQMAPSGVESAANPREHRVAAEANNATAHSSNFGRRVRGGKSEPVQSVSRAAPDRLVVHGHAEGGRAILPTRKPALRSNRRSARGRVRSTVPESLIQRRGVVEGGALVVAPSLSACRSRERRYADRHTPP